MSSEKEDSGELTMGFYLGIGRNRTTRKKGNPKSTQRASTVKAFGRYHDAAMRLWTVSSYDPDHCRMMDDSPNDPGVANA